MGYAGSANPRSPSPSRYPTEGAMKLPPRRSLRCIDARIVEPRRYVPAAIRVKLDLLLLLLDPGRDCRPALRPSDPWRAGLTRTER